MDGPGEVPWQWGIPVATPPVLTGDRASSRSYGEEDVAPLWRVIPAAGITLQEGKLLRAQVRTVSFPASASGGIRGQITFAR